MQFEGIYTPVVTPHTSTYDIDQDKFSDTIELLIGAGVSGLIVAGTTGEYYAQTAEERIQNRRQHSVCRSCETGGC